MGIAGGVKAGGFPHHDETPALAGPLASFRQKAVQMRHRVAQAKRPPEGL